MASINDVNAKEIEGVLYVPVVVKNDPAADIVVVSRTWHPPFLAIGQKIQFMTGEAIISGVIVDIYGDWLRIDHPAGCPGEGAWSDARWFNVRTFSICAKDH